jgi:hypothetical protein
VPCPHQNASHPQLCSPAIRLQRNRPFPICAVVEPATAMFDSDTRFAAYAGAKMTPMQLCVGISTAVFNANTGGIVKILNKKTRKALEKSLRKAIRRHAPAIAAGLATGLASSLATLASTEASEGRGRSNLSKIAEKVQAAFNVQGETDTGKPREQKKTRRPGTAPQEMRTEPAA